MGKIKKIIDLIKADSQKAIELIKEIELGQDLLSFLEEINEDEIILKLFLENITFDEYTFGILYDRLYSSQTQKSRKDIYASAIYKMPKKYFIFEELYELSYKNQDLTSRYQKILTKNLLIQHFKKEYSEKLLEETS